MALRECDESELEYLMRSYPDAIFYGVCRIPIFVKGVRDGFVLALSKKLHDSYRDQKIEWKEYAARYIMELTMSEEAQLLMSEIEEEAKETDVFLVCSCSKDKGEMCHRFILKDLIEEGFLTIIEALESLFDEEQILTKYICNFDSRPEKRRSFTGKKSSQEAV